MRGREVVMLFVLLLAVSGCAATRSAHRGHSASEMARVIAIGGHHCH